LKELSVLQLRFRQAAIEWRIWEIWAYQPASWPFQIYEAALFVVLAPALTGLSVRWVRRRLS